MLIASHQLHYIPWLPYLAKMALADRFVASDDVQYRKGHYINRNRVRGRQFQDGRRWLTIPVSYPVLPDRDSHLAAINQMEIQGDWKQRHADILLSEYRNAPFRHELESYLEATTADKPHSFLWQPLYKELHWLQPDISIASNLFIALKAAGRTFADKNERLITMIRLENGDGYLMGMGAQNSYIDHAAFAAAGITLYRLEMRPFSYPQAGSRTFTPDLGFVDALANVGRDKMWKIVRSSFTVKKVTEL